MAKLKKQQLDLLEDLSKDHQIYIIVDRFDLFEPEIYVCNDFREAVNGVAFHSLRNYKKITSIVDSNSTYVNSPSAIGVINTAIDIMIPITQERKYSETFIWIKL